MSNRPTEPASGFADLELGPRVLRGIAAAGFVEPRPIQLRTIPAALAGRDILGLAQTGTGKTAAFALPLLARLLEPARHARHGARDRVPRKARGTGRPSRGEAGPAAGPRVLIIAPTRELASQISAEIRLLATGMRIGIATLFGGVSASSQIAALRKRPEIVVACPGRLLDLWGQGCLRLDQVTALVLDEADHMFDMGFLPDVRRILDALPERRQNLLFSATMPREIRRLANKVLNDPHVVELSHTKPVATIEHALYSVDGDRKFELLERVLGEEGFVSAIVFTRTKHRAKRLAQQLERSGHRAVALQGNMSQNQRDRAMDGFRTRHFRVLVATDIAARGIDVEQVSHVVNFDVPTTPDAYTHRIGRTGRSERRGRAYTFVTPDDHDLVRAVELRIGAAIPRLDFEGRVEAPAPRPTNGGPTHPAPRRTHHRGQGPGARRARKRRRRRSLAGPAQTR